MRACHESARRWLALAGLVRGVLTLETLAAADASTPSPPVSRPPSVAKKYYGERSLGDLLMRYNGTPGKVIHPGQRLKIPYCESLSGASRVTPGPALAKRHPRPGCGIVDARRARTGTPPASRSAPARASSSPWSCGTISRGRDVVLHRRALLRRSIKSRDAAGVRPDRRRETVGRGRLPLEIPIVSFVRAETEQAAASDSRPRSAPKAAAASVAAPPPQLRRPSARGAAPPPTSDDSRSRSPRSAEASPEASYDRALEILRRSAKRHP